MNDNVMNGAHMQGKVCLVTGATAGIGRVSARRLAEMGATVIIISRNPAKCDEVVAEIRQRTNNPAVEAMPADLSALGQVRAVAQRLLDRYPRIDDQAYRYRRPRGGARYQLLFPLVRVNFELGVIMVIAVSCVKLLSAHNSTQHTSRKHKV
jgi:Short-chain dehydrogenases of various substrate specificities